MHQRDPRQGRADVRRRSPPTAVYGAAPASRDDPVRRQRRGDARGLSPPAAGGIACGSFAAGPVHQLLGRCGRRGAALARLGGRRPGGRAPRLSRGTAGGAARAAGLGTLVLPHRPSELRSSTVARLRAARGVVAHAAEIRRPGAQPRARPGGRLGDAVRARAPAGPRARVPARPFAFLHNDLAPGPADRRGVRAAAARAALVVAPSQVVARDLDPRGRLAGRLRVISPGVDVDRFAELDGPAGEPPEVVVLGALVAWKRPDLALEAVAIARRPSRSCACGSSARRSTTPARRCWGGCRHGRRSRTWPARSPSRASARPARRAGAGHLPAALRAARAVRDRRARGARGGAPSGGAGRRRAG